MNFSLRGAASRLLFTILLLFVVGASDAAIRVASPDCLYTGDLTCGDGIDQEIKGSDTKTPPSASFFNLDVGKYSANAKDGYFTSPFVKTADTSSSSGTIVEKAGVYSVGRGGGPFSVTNGTYFLWAKVLVPETAVLRDRFICVDTSPIPETIDTAKCAFLAATFDPQSPPSFGWQKVGALADFGNATNGTAHVSFPLSGAGAFYFAWHEQVKVDCFYISTDENDTPVCPSGAPATGITHNGTFTGAGGTGTSLGLTGTVAAGAERICLVGVAHRTSTNTISSVSSDVDGAFTLLNWVAAASVANAVYYKIAPSTGAHTITVTFSTSQNAAANAVCYNGVHQSTPFDPMATKSEQNVASGSHSIASTTERLVIDHISMSMDTAATITPGTGQTERWEQSAGIAGTANRISHFSTEQGDSSVTRDWTFSNSTNHYMLQATSLRTPQAGGVPPTITNQQTTLVGNTTVTIEAEVNQTVDCRVDYDIDSGTPYANSSAVVQSTGGKCIIGISGLTSGTQHFYRTCADNGVEAEVCHAEGTFTTSSALTALGWTQAEKDIWVTRRTNGPYRSVGDVSTNSPGDYDRIKAEADAFKASPTAERWTAQSRTSDCVRPGDPEPAVKRHIGLRSAAFVYFLTGDTSYLTPVTNELLFHAGLAGLNFANRPPWCFRGDVSGVTTFGGTHPWMDYGSWLSKLVLAYDFIRNDISAANKTTLDTWFTGMMNYFRSANDNWFTQENLFVDRLNENWTLTANGESRACEKGSKATHLNGFFSNGLMYHSNRTLEYVRLYGMLGVLFNNAAAKDSFKVFVKEAIQFSTFPDGTWFEFNRWTATNPQLGWGYTGQSINHMGLVIDLLARQGDTDLYNYSTSNGAGGCGGNTSTAGGPKSFKLIVENFFKHMLNYPTAAGAITRYGTDDPAKDGNANYIIGPVQKNPDTGATNSERIWDVWDSINNVFWRDGTLKAQYLRTASGTPAYPSTPAGGNEWWGSSGMVLPGSLFMVGQMESVIWPYPGVDP